MAEDPFQQILGLEEEFYREGFEAGVADSTYTGMVEGKVFGIEKGYEKALELAKMRGRAMVWNIRASGDSKLEEEIPQNMENLEDVVPLSEIKGRLDRLPTNSRLAKHIQTLLSLTDDTDLKTDNSDQAVSDLDDRLAKARTKTKVIATIVKEPLNPVLGTNSGIEDATGLKARH